MITAASYGNIPFYSILPMGISNYGGDTQVYAVPDYTTRTIGLNLNTPAQLQLAQNSSIGMGGMNLGINMPTVDELADAMYNAGMNAVAQSEVASANNSLSSTKAKLNSLNSNGDLDSQDKKSVEKQLKKLKKLEKELEELKKSEDLTPEEAFKKAKKINDELKEILTITNEISSRVSGAMSEASEISEDAEDESDYSGKKISGKDSSQYGPKFLKKVKDIAKRLNCDYRDLLGVMNSESGIDASAKNPNGSATGLIQFIESTARSLGTTTAALRRMSPIKQLDYVEKCLMNAKSAAGFSSSHRLSAGELYALIFLPARANREVLTTRGENYYAANKGLDKNKDGKITKSELGNRVISYRVSDNSFLA